MASHKCTICKKQFKNKETLVSHIEKIHSDSIPEDWSASRYENYLRTGKTSGNCVQCKEPTDWNESTMKYKRFCNNPACKEAYVKIAKSRMIGKYGVAHKLNDPEQQRKMIYAKKTSGEYVWSDDNTVKFKYASSNEKDALEMMDVFLNWEPDDILCPSPHTYYYEYEGKQHMYIPDIYIISLNLEIEIKDGDYNDPNRNKHPKIEAVDRVKEKLKDELMLSLSKQVNYVKVPNKDYRQLFTKVFQLKESNIGEKTINNVPEEVKENFIMESHIVDEPLENIDLIFEETDIFGKLDPTRLKFKPVYILLTRQPGDRSKLIRAITGQPYSHSSIGFGSDLDKMYSFSRRSSDSKKAQFTVEGIHRGLLGEQFDKIEYSLYCYLSPQDQFEKMQKHLKNFLDNMDKFKYNTIGLIEYLFGKSNPREGTYFCSEFVAEMLKIGNPNILKKDRGSYSPCDIVKERNIFFIKRGQLKNYNKSEVDKKVMEKAIEMGFVNDGIDS